MTEIYALIVAALISVIGGIIAYVVQKNYERLEARQKRHFDVNLELMSAIASLASAYMGYGDMNSAQRDYVLAKMKFVSFASDESVKCLANLDDHFSKRVQEQYQGEVNNLIARLIRAIRKESLGATYLSNDVLIRATPFRPISPD